MVMDVGKDWCTCPRRPTRDVFSDFASKSKSAMSIAALTAGKCLRSDCSLSRTWVSLPRSQPIIFSAMDCRLLYAAVKFSPVTSGAGAPAPLPFMSWFDCISTNMFCTDSVTRPAMAHGAFNFISCL